jgi:hypothetical protein
VHEPLAVRLGDRFTGLQDVLDGVFDGDDAEPCDFDAEIDAIEQLEHHVRRTGGQRADVEDARDVLALDRHRGLCFPQKTRREIAAVRDLVAKEFDRDRGAECQMGRRDDDAHPALA